MKKLILGMIPHSRPWLKRITPKNFGSLVTAGLGVFISLLREVTTPTIETDFNAAGNLALSKKVVL